MFPQALAYWPGVNQIESFSGSFGLGSQASVFRLDIIPQSMEQIFKYGDLTLEYGHQILVFKTCAIDSAISIFNNSGEVTQLAIRDFRWKWAFPSAYGIYNLRDSQGRLVEIPDGPASNAVAHGKRSARVLCNYLLQQMEVDERDLSAVPDDQYPTVSWDADNAARELESLLSQFGLRIAPRPDGSVKIVHPGEGEQLPDGPAEVISNELDYPNQPKEIVAWAGRSRYQHDFELEYVGMEIDGTIKLIDDLSYAPDDWLKIDHLDMTAIVDENDDSDSAEAIREAAAKSVFRMFRIVKPETVGGFLDPIDVIEQVLPLESVQVDQTTLPNGDVVSKPAIVWGFYDPEDDAKGNEGNELGNNVESFEKINPEQIQADFIDSLSVVKTSFQMDEDKGIVTFSRPVVSRGEGAAIGYATLRLRTAFSIRTPDDGSYKRFARYETVSSDSPGGRQAIAYDDIAVSYGLISDNSDFVNNELGERINSIRSELIGRPAYTATYAAWLYIPLDGSIRSIAWVTNQSGATTTIQYNSDAETRISNAYWQRQRTEKLKRVLDDQSRARSGIVRAIELATKAIFRR